MHTRCPHCHQPVEIVDHDPLTEISCSSCGSSFSLITSETVTYAARKIQRIGRFELLEEVGLGAFGSVWKAQDTELDRIVAVKLPRQDQLDEVEQERFLREARATAQLNHPGIVSIHEVGNEDGQLYIVSDFIHGATLREWCDAKPKKPSLRRREFSEKSKRELKSEGLSVN